MNIVQITKDCEKHRGFVLEKWASGRYHSARVFTAKGQCHSAELPRALVPSQDH